MITSNNKQHSQPRKIEGVLAEFDNPAQLIQAASKVREKGYKFFDCYSPFPIHGMDAAMGIKPSKLGWFVAVSGLIGGILAMLMQGWMSAVDYKVMISGKPFFSYQAFIPITFELVILFAALTAVFGMFAFNMLPCFHHPVFYSERFRKVTDDGFFLGIESGDPQFREKEATKFLKSLGAKYVEALVPDV